MRSKFTYLLTEAAKIYLKEDMLPAAGQQQPPPPPAPVAAPQAAPAPPQTDPNAPVPPATPDTLTVDTVIDRLNVIRGGKSFTEPEIYKAMSDFFNTVPQTDREIIDRFLTGLGSVVANTPNSQQGVNPTNATQQTGMGQPPPPTAPAQQPSAAPAPSAAPMGAM